MSTASAALSEEDRAEADRTMDRITEEVFQRFPHDHCAAYAALTQEYSREMGCGLSTGKAYAFDRAGMEIMAQITVGAMAQAGYQRGRDGAYYMEQLSSSK